MNEKNTSPVFNLVDDPWISVVTTDGESRLVSLRELLRASQSIRRISGESPPQDFAILRLLIAILWRVYTRSGDLIGPDGEEFEDADEWWLTMLDAGGLTTEEIEKYLDEYYDRFWLIHPTQPLYQVAGLATEKGGHTGIERLIADAESDYFTSRAGEKLEALEYAESARWLLHAQSYDYSGIKPAAVGDERAKGGKGYPIGTGSAGVGGGVVIHGQNLFETLLLNLPANRVADTARDVSDGKTSDVPVWEQPTHTSASRTEEASIPLGVIDALTWQSRRIRLFLSDGKIIGVLITNGDKLELKNNRTDPFFGRQYSKNLSSKTEDVYLPKKHYSERTFWRGVESLLYRHAAFPENAKVKSPTELPDNILYLSELTTSGLSTVQHRVNVELVGIEYGTQDSVISDLVHTEIPLQLFLLTAEGSTWSKAIVQSVRNTLSAASAIGSFAGMVGQAAGGEYKHNSDQTQAVLAELEQKFRGWLSGLSAAEDGSRAVQTWHQTARTVILTHADTIVHDAGPQAYQGRITVPNSDQGEGKTQLKSVGTARIWLLSQLKKYLPVEKVEQSIS